MLYQLMPGVWIDLAMTQTISREDPMLIMQPRGIVCVNNQTIECSVEQATQAIRAWTAYRLSGNPEVPAPANLPGRIDAGSTPVPTAAQLTEAFLNKLSDPNNKNAQEAAKLLNDYTRLRLMPDEAPSIEAVTPIEDVKAAPWDSTDRRDSSPDTTSSS